MIKINKNLISINHTSKKRNSKDIQWIVVHYVGALGDAKANTDYYKSNNVGASADFFVGFSGDIWQANDYYNFYSWHCGGGYQSSWTQNGGGKYYGQCLNSNSIGIEMCVRKKSTKTMNATDTDWYFEDATVESTAQLVVYLMKELDVDIDHVIRHYDVNRKICPNPWVIDNNKWIAFKEKIKQYYGNSSTTVSEPLYRVRKSWADSSSQIFAGTLEGAKNACTSGYAVYDENGKEVYRAPVSSIREQNQKILDSLPDYKGLPDNQQDYINKVAEICVKLYPYTKILPSVVISQSFLENGGGTAADAIELTKRNNLIGQKASLLNNTWSEYTVWDGTKFSKRTPENYGNGIVYITDWFRVFPSYKYSILDYEMFLSWAKNDSGYKYRDVIGMTDPQKMITLISQKGYATGTTYISSVMRIIKQYNLTKYDVMAGVSTSDDYTTAPTTSISYYRVAQSYKDGTYVGQIGAYSSKDNALASAKENNLNCYDPDGKIIYTASTGKVTEVAYRVQCGEFEVKKNCKAMVKQMKKRGFDAKTVKLARKRYIAQAGVFSIKSNAERLRKQIEEAGLPCIIVEQEV